MSKSACWAYNNTTDCCWVHFGYGSRWDCCGGCSKKGYWLSKDAIKVLLYYDYEIRCMFDQSEEDIVKKGIPFKSSTIVNRRGVFSYDYKGKDWDDLPFKNKVMLSYLHLSRPEWFNEVEPFSGGYLRDNPGSTVPFLEDIKDINVDHYNAIKRMYEMNDIAVSSEPPRLICGMTYTAYNEMMKPYIDEWLKEMEEEDIIRKQVLAKKWNSWNRIFNG